MSESAAPATGTPKPKKSVALSGVTAGNTALCTVGRTGNDLHYRGYDILEIAGSCEFEEIAYLLIHEKLPNRAELAAYKAKSARIDVGKFKELTGVSRKYAIPLLEYLDRERVTKRVGDERVIL